MEKHFEQVFLGPKLGYNIVMYFSLNAPSPFIRDLNRGFVQRDCERIKSFLLV
jgi:hypothetical protein